MLTCKEIFVTHQVIPVVTIDDITKATSLAIALINGGINIIEITLRTPNALKIIEKIAQEIPQITVGAGTIINKDLYRKAVSHGAKFIVSPGLTQEIIDVSHEYNVPLLPGAVTPSEMMLAYSSGFNYLKFFPAENYNGRSNLKTLANIFPQLKFCPTGGINSGNAEEYLSLPNVVGIGVSTIVNSDLIATNNFAKITELSKQFINYTKTT